jgi:hypothetical protein
VALLSARAPLPDFPTEAPETVVTANGRAAPAGARTRPVATSTLGVWSRLRSALASLRRWSRSVRDERRSTKARAQFWSDVREGEREAETNADPDRVR